MLIPFKKPEYPKDRHIRAAIKAGWKQKVERREARREMAEVRG